MKMICKSILRFFFVTIPGTGELGNLFRRDGRTPQCLEEVVQEGRSAGLFAEPAAYLSGSGTRSDGATWGAWLLGLGAGMVRSLGSAVLGPAQSPAAEFVVTSQVEKVRNINRQFMDVCYGFLLRF
jgi:hypothetical protein